MAVSKSTGKKNTARAAQTKRVARRTGASQMRRKETRQTARRKRQFVRGEVAIVVLLAVGVFMVLISLGLMGSLGHAINSFLRGLFGQVSLLFGAALIAMALEDYYERGRSLKNPKLLAILGIFLLCTCFAQLLSGDTESGSLSIVRLYQEGATGAAGGGALGGIIANALCAVTGRSGAWLLLIALLIICLVVLTERSIVALLGAGMKKSALLVHSGAQKTVDAARNAAYERRERRRAHAPGLDYQDGDRETAATDAAPDTAKRADPDSFTIAPPYQAAGSVNTSLDSFRPQDANRAAGSYAAFTSETKAGGPFVAYRSPASSSSYTRPDRQPDLTAAGSRSAVSVADTPAYGQDHPDTETLAHFDPATADYDVDTVPFVETRAEKYRSYYTIIHSGQVPGVIDIARGSSFGYAVGNKAEMDREETASRFSPVSSDIFADIESDLSPVQETEGDPGNGEKGKVLYPESTSGYDEPEADEDTGYRATDGAIHKSADADKGEINFKAIDEGGSGSTAKVADIIPFSQAARTQAGGAQTASRFSAASGGGEASGKEAGKAVSSVSLERPEPRKPYVFPSVELLKRGRRRGQDSSYEQDQNARKLEKVLKDFGVGVRVTNVISGPRVSRYEMIPDTGVKVSRITALAGDIKLALAATELRIEAPIPGKSAVGIEIPNKSNQLVRFRDILESDAFKSARSKLSWGLGLDIQGRPVVADISRMPHVLVAGTTGSGKSVGINSLIMSILYRATPEEVQMILIDPKVVELSVYNGIPHLLTDVVTKPERAVSALSWAVEEMNRRYKQFEQSGTRNITGYNDKVERALRSVREDVDDVSDQERPRKLPLILIVIDELSELMMHSKKDVEGAIVSLSQLARAAGIHLVVATQRPSVDVITGLIKSNIPSRIAYRLPSAVDSRTILDAGGAETLLGNGDMLYKPGDKNSPERLQGAFLEDEEVEAVVRFIRKNNSPATDTCAFDEAINTQMELDLAAGSPETQGGPDRDEYFADAGRLIINSKKASIGALQRKFKVGFNRAARIMDQLHEAGVVSDSDGTKERQILMSLEQFEQVL